MSKEETFEGVCVKYDVHPLNIYIDFMRQIWNHQQTKLDEVTAERAFQQARLDNMHKQYKELRTKLKEVTARLEASEKLIMEASELLWSNGLTSEESVPVLAWEDKAKLDELKNREYVEKIKEMDK